MENTILSVWQIESNLFKNLSQLFIIIREKKNTSQTELQHLSLELQDF